MPRFRAWDESGKRYVGSEVCLIGELVIKSSYSATRWAEEAQLINLCQYTGLKDQNGIEIFEGDIVRVTDDDERTDFSDGGIGTVCGLEELYMWYIDGEVQNGIFDINQSYYIEVLGNIYENPELLEVSEW